MDVHARMSDADASDYYKLKKSLLTRYNYTEDGYRKRFREAKSETEETPDKFIIRLKIYLAKYVPAMFAREPSRGVVSRRYH